MIVDFFQQHFLFIFFLVYYDSCHLHQQLSSFCYIAGPPRRRSFVPQVLRVLRKRAQRNPVENLLGGSISPWVFHLALGGQDALGVSSRPGWTRRPGWTSVSSRPGCVCVISPWVCVCVISPWVCVSSRPRKRHVFHLDLALGGQDSFVPPGPPRPAQDGATKPGGKSPSPQHVFYLALGGQDGLRPHRSFCVDQPQVRYLPTGVVTKGGEHRRAVVGGSEKIVPFLIVADVLLGFGRAAAAFDNVRRTRNVQGPNRGVCVEAKTRGKSHRRA